jgi:hypothetical protein
MSLATPLFLAWVAGPALLPFSELTVVHTAVGVVGTYGVAGLALGLLHRRAVVEVDHRQRHVPQPERRRVGVAR